MKTKFAPGEYELLRQLQAQHEDYAKFGQRSNNIKYVSMFAFYISWVGPTANAENFSTFLRKATASRKAAFKNFLHAYTVYRLVNGS